MSTKRSRPGSDDPTAASTQVSDVAPWLTSSARRPCIIDDDEPMGGDPPCWAHLFEDGDEAPPTDR